MRRLLLVLASLALASCTQDFDNFTIGGSGAGAGATAGVSGSPSTGGAGGTAGLDASLEAGGAGGGAGDLDASDAAEDAPPDGASCGPGTKPCEGTCVLETNPAFGCAETTCAPCSIRNASATCDLHGKCAIAACDDGYSDCNGLIPDGCETQVAADPANCGGCAARCELPNATARCTGAKCSVESCSDGFMDCNGDATDGCETNILADPSRCGSCSNDCTSSAGNWSCDDGQCAVSQCPDGQADCDGNSANGCETDTTSSVLHCGFCRNICNLPNATAKCEGSQCLIDSCTPGFADCDGLDSNGCETNLKTSTASCGACGRACSSAGTLALTCSDGLCTSACLANFANCSRPATGPDDGCESDLRISPDHCGACGRACSTAHATTPVCAGGTCASTCEDGWGNCLKPAAPVADDGCETNLASNLSSCGACGHSCSGANTTGLACSAGKCAPTCASGYADCATPPENTADDGCEARTSSDPDNCGACGRACASANILTRSCTLGTCDSTCKPGFGNCNLPATGSDDGCETDLLGDAANCGLCGRTCAATHASALACAGGVCTSSCEPGFGNCTRPSAPASDDGCETETLENAANCGACGRTCSLTHASSTACHGGACAPSCTGTFADCSSPPAASPDDGCETDLETSSLDCGACGRACGGTNVEARMCSGGLCRSSCALGSANCSTPAAPAADNACETPSSKTACGSCTNDCTKQGLQGCSNNVCACTKDSECESLSRSCNGGLCVCNNLGGSNTCRPGEKCGGFVNDCHCNGGDKCSSSQVCCQQGGCKTLSSDAANCGACGRACAPGFVCASSKCACDGDVDCNGGTPGACSGGVCKCGATTCGPGQRCLSNGTCG